MSSGVISSLNLDRGFQKYFLTSKYPISYGKVKVSPMLLQDDALSLSSCQSGAQDASSRVEMLMKSKQLDINVEKSVMLLFCNKKRRNEITKEIKENPLTYNGIDIELKTQEKWLGEMISSDDDHITATIIARKGRIINAIHEVIAILEDTRMQRIGGVQCGLDLWEICIIPSLLSNSGTWSGLKDCH